MFGFSSTNKKLERVVKSASTNIQFQLDMAKDLKIDNYTARTQDSFSCGYYFGYSHALMQSSGLDVHNHVLETLQKVYVTLFGSQYGKDLFDSSLENMEDELFKLGMMTGGADVYKQLEPDNQIAHVSLAAYLRDSDAFVALVRDLYK